MVDPTQDPRRSPTFTGWVLTGHTMKLGTSRIDDGIHITCECGWDVCLGFDASPDDAAGIARLHLTFPGVRDPRPIQSRP